MENYSAINPLLLSQPSSIETIKNLSQQKDTNTDALSLKKASHDFESILINFIINAMWKTIPKSDLFGENNAGMETYTEIMHTALSQDIASKGGFGVASIIYKQLMHNKELAEKPFNRPPLLKDNNNTINLKRVNEEELVYSNDGKDNNGVNPS
ncbi:MAG: rod-binding protein [Candidatus Brocadia sp.]